MLTQQFEIENKKRANRNKLSGTVITIVVHALILLVLFLIILPLNDPPFEDNGGGVTVNYGTSETGTGDEQAYTAVPVTVSAPEETAPTAPAVADNTEQPLETQDKEDAAAVVEKKPEKKKPKEKVNPEAEFKPKETVKKAVAAPAEVKPKVEENALFKPGATGKPNKSKGDGEGGGAGDQGKPDGDPNSKNYHGGGHGNGTGNGDGNGVGSGSGNGPGGGGPKVSLGGRGYRRPGTQKNPCEEFRGKVVIVIKVDRSGKVVETSYTQNGSTSSDDCLVNFAKQLATKYHFDAKEDAPEAQTGSITFKFGLD